MQSNEKRLFLSLALALLVLFAWSKLTQRIAPAPPPPPAPELLAEKPTALPEPEAATSGPALMLEPTVAGEERHITIETDLYRAVLSNRGARMVSFTLRKFAGDGGLHVELIPTEVLDQAPFDLETVPQLAGREANAALYEVTGSDTVLLAGDPGTQVRFRYSGPTGVAVEKVFGFTPESYVVDVEVQHCLPETREVSVALGPGFGEAAADGEESTFVYTGHALALQQGKVHRFAPKDAEEVERLEGRLGWIGLETRYFVGALLADAGGELDGASIRPQPGRPGEGPRLRVVARLGEGGGKLRAYLGPKELATLRAVEPSLDGVVDFGFLGGLAKLMLPVLRAINSQTGNYGFAIVIMTVLLRVGFFPLTYKSQVAMMKMQKLKPRINEIEQKYNRPVKDRLERMKLSQQKNAEVMALYKKEGVDPAAGCLPSLIQLPFLWAFYGLLSASIELRHAPFVLWIHDLSAKDVTYILPLLMGASMFVVQAMTPTTADPMQKKIFYLMPIMFTYFFLELPSGLALYWLTTNVASIVQQGFMNRRHPADATPHAERASGRRRK